jgi:hypothetical protein
MANFLCIPGLVRQRASRKGVPGSPALFPTKESLIPTKEGLVVGVGERRHSTITPNKGRSHSQQLSEKRADESAAE